jgi:hydrogenase maturation protein HypF
VRLPGGEQAIRQPWRMACAWLGEAEAEAEAEGEGGAGVPELPPWLNGLVEPGLWEQVGRLAAGGLASPVTTSAGRLFDAVAALCGLRAEINYEGQAAIELEAACDPHERGFYALPLIEADGELVLDARETVCAVVSDLRAGAATGTIAARFHNALAAATTCACLRLAAESGIGTVALGGGTFQNRRLLETVACDLERAGVRVLVPERLPPNDGGVSFGQAAVASARIAGSGS